MVRTKIFKKEFTEKEIQNFIRYMIMDVMVDEKIRNLKEKSGKQIHFFPLKLSEILTILLNKQIQEKEYVFTPELVDEFLTLFENEQISYSLVDQTEHVIIHKVGIYPDIFRIIGEISNFIKDNYEYITDSIIENLNTRITMSQGR